MLLDQSCTYRSEGEQSLCPGLGSCVWFGRGQADAPRRPLLTCSALPCQRSLLFHRAQCSHAGPHKGPSPGDPDGC